MSLLMKVSPLRFLIKIILDVSCLKKESICSEIPFMELNKRAECFRFYYFTEVFLNIVDKWINPVADPGLPRGGSTILLFGQIFPENYMKIN